MTSTSAFGAVLTIVVLLGIAVAILVFERPRSRRIERDLREQAREREEEPGAPPDSGTPPDSGPPRDEGR